MSLIKLLMLKRKDTIVAKMTNKSTRKVGNDGDLGGFTIIEVVLVLAIAGLIFLMVFIALPALQRAQRDSQRRTDLGRVTEAILNYQGNNNGRLPTDDSTEAVKENPETGQVDLVEYSCITGTAGNAGESAQYKASDGKTSCKLILEYLNGAGAQYSEWVDPDGYGYGLSIETYSGETPQLIYDDHMVHIVKGAVCNGEELLKSNNSRDYAVMYRLEGSGVYCQSNG